NYRGAGTVEFIFDAVNQKFYFMEMNTRIQVEHTVTEMITGIDLIQQQLRVASGETLAYKQEDVTFKGWSIECRINAENPAKNFMPSAGKIDMYLPQGGLGVRIDSAMNSGYTIPPYYDSIVDKLINSANTSEEEVAKINRALYVFIIEGVLKTNPFRL